MRESGKIKLPVILGIAFVVAIILALAYTSGVGKVGIYHCEVCVTFEGRTICRNAAAPTKEEAVRTGGDTACTDLSSGMTSLMQCQNNAPKRVTWK